MRWATRRNCHIDRAARGWWSRKVVAPKAGFVFAGNPQELPLRASSVDMAGGSLPRQRGRRNFEAMASQFGWVTLSSGTSLTPLMRPI